MNEILNTINEKWDIDAYSLRKAYYNAHPWLADSYFDYSDGLYSLLDIASKAKTGAQLAEGVRDYFVTVTPAEVLEILLQVKDELKSKDQLIEAMEAIVAHEGFRNGRRAKAI